MKKTFIQNSKAWYGEACLKGKNLVDEFVIMVNDEKESFVGEFVVVFTQIGGRMTISAQIQCFDDGARALEACPEIAGMIAVLHEISQNARPHDFSGQLLANGYEDITPKYATDTMGEESVSGIKDDIFEQIKVLQGVTDWDNIPGQMMSIGLFVKNGKYFVAAINVGSPDSHIDIIGASIYGSSSISIGDEQEDHLETLDMLLMDSNKFYQACSPNHLVGS